jgi:hypothetical protein
MQTSPENTENVYSNIAEKDVGNQLVRKMMYGVHLRQPYHQH